MLRANVLLALAGAGVRGVLGANATIPAIPNPVTGTGVLLANASLFAALPFPFERTSTTTASILNITFPSNGTAPITGYGGVPSVAEVQANLNALSNVSFIGFQPRFVDIASGTGGGNGTARVERLFANGDYHEAVVYIPETHSVFLAGVAGDNQYLIDLTTNTLSNFTSSPPVENVNGGTYNNGKLYLATNGGPRGAAGIYAVDVLTGQASVVIDNYRGLSFNSPNDVVVDKSGNIWFTDEYSLRPFSALKQVLTMLCFASLHPTYGFLNKLNPKAPQLTTGVWFFNTTSQLVSLVVNDIPEPNGLVLSPDETVLYVGDTGGANIVYAYDVINGRFLGNKRVFYLSNTGIPDGTKVTTNGDFYTVSGVGGSGGYGLEVADANGQPLGQIVVPVNADTIKSTFSNFAFAPSVRNNSMYDTIWAAGGDAIWKISGLNVQGVVL